MDDLSATIRGLINDLTRTLTGSIVHLDDLLLQLSTNSEGYDDAYLADQQLGRALEFFFEMRSLFIMWKGRCADNSIRNISNNANLLLDKISHMVNNALTVIFGCCDLILINNVDNETQDNLKMIYSVAEQTKLFITNSRNEMNNAKTINIPPNNVHFNNIDFEVPIKKGKYNNNINMLFVEDEYDVRKFVCAILEKRGYDILTAETGKEALEIYEKHADIINFAFVDVKLPDISGLDLVNQIILRNHDIKILFTSGYNDDQLGDVINQGYRILKKPFRLTDLFGELDNLCQKN